MAGDDMHARAVERVRRLFPGWSIRPVDLGTGLTAHHADGRRAYGEDVIDLLLKLDEAELEQAAGLVLPALPPDAFIC